MHKIILFKDNVRKKLGQKFWSLGTNLRYLGPVSQKGLGEIFSKPLFLFILGLNNFPEVMNPFPLAKNLKTFAS